MNKSLVSKTSQPGTGLDIPQDLRELVAAMPIVIFARAIAAAFGSRRRAEPVTLGKSYR